MRCFSAPHCSFPVPVPSSKKEFYSKRADGKKLEKNTANLPKCIINHESAEIIMPRVNAKQQQVSALIE
jgi:hypothetical protein